MGPGFSSAGGGRKKQTFKIVIFAPLANKKFAFIFVQEV
jgi:hypothetical protein